MAEYIERDKAVKAAIDGADEWDGCYNRNRDSYIESSIDNVPNADVVPVVRGEWVPSDMQEGWVTCSVCKKLKFDGRMALSPDLFEEWGLNFCPNCGARMDEERGGK